MLTFIVEHKKFYNLGPMESKLLQHLVVILDGNFGEKVSLSWLTSPYRAKGEVKMYRMYRENQNWIKTSPWNPENVEKLLPLWKL